MNNYTIANVCCDDITWFTINLTEDQLKFVIRLFEENNKFANCCCTPHLFIFDTPFDTLFISKDKALNRDFYSLNEIDDPYND